MLVLEKVREGELNSLYSYALGTFLKVCYTKLLKAVKRKEAERKAGGARELEEAAGISGLALPRG